MKNVGENLLWGAFVFLTVFFLFTAKFHCGDSFNPVDTVYTFVPETIYVHHKDTIKADKIIYRFRNRVDSIPCLDGADMSFNLPNGAASVAFSVDSGATLSIHTTDTIIDTDTIIQATTISRAPVVCVGMMAGFESMGPAAAIQMRRVTVSGMYDLRKKQINLGILIPLHIFTTPKEYKGRRHRTE